MVPKTHFFNSVSSQKLFASGIVSLLYRKPMLRAVKFDGKFCGGTIEIEPVDAERVLAAEFESGETARFQGGPQFLFILRLLAPQAAGIGGGIHVDEDRKCRLK